MRQNLLAKIKISYLIVIAAIVSPLIGFSLVPGASFHDNQRIIEIVCVFLISIMSIVRLRGNITIKQVTTGSIFWLFALFFLLGLISSILAYSSRHALFEWANFLLLVGISGLVASEISANTSTLLDKLLLLCGIGCGCYVFLQVIAYFAVINVGGQPPNAILISGFSNYRFFNHIQTITLPLLGLFICRSGGGKQTKFAWIVTSVWWALLFVSAGRGTFIGLLAGAFIALVCLRKDALAWIRVLLWSALAGLCIYFVFYVLIPKLLGLQPFGFLFSVGSRTVEDPGSGRWPLWVRAWEIMLNHPWLGVGPLHFGHYGRDVQLGAHPHNWMLQIACEWGIPALLCLFAIIKLGFQRLLSVHKHLLPNDSKNLLTLAALLTAAGAILVDGLVSGLIVMPTSQLWIALYIGIAWGWVTSIIPTGETLRLSISARICSALSLLSLVYFLGNGLWPEIGNLPFYEEQSLQKQFYPNPVYRPRIWLGGYF